MPAPVFRVFPEDNESPPGSPSSENTHRRRQHHLHHHHHHHHSGYSSGVESSADSDEDPLADEIEGTGVSKAEEELHARTPGVPATTTNRDFYGTWKRPLDFLVTMVAYVLGPHNFFRFPHMAYKWGAVPFLVPYLVLHFGLGIPASFMESTIGQFYGVGSATCWAQLAPVISGVSTLMAWKSFISGWLTVLMLTWIRSYSGDSLSCIKGWRGCSYEHYFNTPFCYTAVLDDCCAGVIEYEGEDWIKCPPDLFKAVEEGGHQTYQIYYDFACKDIRDVCLLMGWTFEGGRICLDAKGKRRSVYERRTHAATEYLYGFVFGLRKRFVTESRKIEKKKCDKFYGPKRANESCTNSAIVRNTIDGGQETNTSFRSQVFQDGKFVKSFWSSKNQSMEVEPGSNSYRLTPIQGLTTVFFLGFFLYADLLSISILNYVLASFPFVILTWMCYLALNFGGAAAGINDIFSFNGFKNMGNADLWVDAFIQVLLSSGMGNGPIISLASFNQYRHSFLFDLLLVASLDVIVSLAATIVVFCTIGHYVSNYGISQNFHDVINVESASSSVDFGFTVYSIFLTLVEGNDFATLLFFFMISAFPSDTAARLGQNVLDSAGQMLPRLRPHPTLTLFATMFFFFVTLLPVTQNGGFIIYLQFEYLAERFTFPLVALIEVACVGWVYKASRLLDDAEVMGLVIPVFRIWAIFALQIIFPISLLALVIYNAYVYISQRPVLIDIWTEGNQKFGKDAGTLIVGSLFSVTPLLIFLLSIIKHLVSHPREKWGGLFMSAVSWNKVKNINTRQKEEAKTAREALTFQRAAELMLAKRKRSSEAENNKWSKIKEVIAPPSPPKEEEDDGIPKDSEFELRTLIQQTKVQQENSRFPKRRKDADADKSSLNSGEVTKWKFFIFWSEKLAHLEDWPDRLDDSEVESEADSSAHSEEEGLHYHSIQI